MEAVDEARECISKHSACCFCQRNDSLLLWSHYADQHRGICLEFSFVRHGVGVHEIDRSQDGKQYLLGEVNYSKQRPSLLVNTDDASVVPYELIDKSLFTKSLDWSYEEEWRFVMRNSPEVAFKGFAAKCLRRVIFGMRCSAEDEEEILQMASSKYPHVGFGKAKKHQFNYAVDIKDVDKKSN